MHPESILPRHFTNQIDLRTVLATNNGVESLQQSDGIALKMKLLQFTEDVRPAYYGTWTKSSKIITSKNPFHGDTDVLDYDHDSEAEWEPEGEGEDIRSGDEDDDDMPEAGELEDVGWLVPEGYLSDGEGIEDDTDGISKVVQRLSVRPGSRKALSIRPMMVGPIFDDSDNESTEDALRPFRLRFLSTCQGLSHE
ncbi:hypothetical protein DM01DRAFT_1114470 [Hesseltinella vesiculosa]|uniref:Chromatin assembly factor 1 subunit A dimerization domain-containing protein n=1 Tax=Hesseltinella vesiculosa TaxID=101127 RepID=A0A1X2GB98_9FUNG|nr:hypothetical protein DM01DRAFT_1114470 [Hesseltinella vesiculosa]